jgi:hypothetical protein
MWSLLLYILSSLYSLTTHALSPIPRGMRYEEIDCSSNRVVAAGRESYTGLQHDNEVVT